MIAHTKDYNIDESWIGLYGSSAGANLALVTALQARERNIPICGLILRIPPSCHPSVFPTDHYPYESYTTHANAPILNREAMNNFFATYASGADVKDYRLSPLLADMKGLPSTYMEIAGCDPLRDDGLALCTKMKAAKSVLSSTCSQVLTPCQVSTASQGSSMEFHTLLPASEVSRKRKRPTAKCRSRSSES